MNPWIIHGLSVDFSWIIHGFSMDYYRIIDALSMDYQWIINGLSMDNPWIIHGLSMDYPWVIHGYPWTIHGLSMDYPWKTKSKVDQKWFSKVMWFIGFWHFHAKRKSSKVGRDVVRKMVESDTRKTIEPHTQGWVISKLKTRKSSRREATCIQQMISMMNFKRSAARL